MQFDTSRSVFAFRFKRLGSELSVGLLEEDLDTALGFLELLLSIAR